MESGLLTNLSFRRPESCEKTFIFIILDISLFQYGRLKHMYSIAGCLFRLKNVVIVIKFMTSDVNQDSIKRQLLYFK